MQLYTIIYRKSDKAICAYCHPRKTEEMRLEQVAVTFNEICTSSVWRGEPEDFAVIEVPDIFHDKDPIIDEFGGVTWVDNQETIDTRIGREKLATKLKALGLDDDDLRMLRVGNN